jgi:hypothetical protein
MNVGTHCDVYIGSHGVDKDLHKGGV